MAGEGNSRPDKQQGSLLQTIYTLAVQQQTANVDEKSSRYISICVLHPTYNLLASSIKMHIRIFCNCRRTQKPKMSIRNIYLYYLVLGNRNYGNS